MEYLKVDLHVHTRFSSCYEDHMAPEAGLYTTPEDIVEAAVAAGLQGIAITDHNTAAGIDDMRAAAGRNGLVILPALEVSARGGHLLAFFERDTPVPVLCRLLHSLGFSDREEGDGFEQTDTWIDEVFRLVVESGGLAVAAHIDRRPRGFIASEEPLSRKIQIHSSPYLSALEITSPQDREKWNQGLVPRYPKKYACIQGSDAHAPDEMGRRPVYLKVPELTLESLRLAFRDFQERIRFPEEMEGPSPPPARQESLYL